MPYFFHINIKRSNGDAIDLKVPNSSGECADEDHRICGVISNENKSYQTCIHKDLKCPITDIQIKSIYDQIDKDYSDEAYLLGENKVMFVSRNAPYPPVVQLKLTEGYPCIEEQEYDVSPNKHIYKLLNKKPKGCNTKLEDGTVFDSRYRYIASISEYDLLLQNNIFRDLYQKPMNENQTLSMFYTLNLYCRSYIEWNPKCDKEDSPHQTYYILKAVERVCWWQSLFNFTCLINMITSGFILGIINLVISAYKICGSKEANKKNSRIFRYVAWWEEMTQVDSLIFEKNQTSTITIEGIIEKGFRAVCVTLNKLSVIFYIINILIELN